MKSRKTIVYEIKKRRIIIKCKKENFDIAKCKCLSVSKCICKIKLSFSVHNFLLDQKNTRALNLLDLSPRKRKLSEHDLTDDNEISLSVITETDGSNQITIRQISSMSDSLTVSSVDLE